MWKSGCRLNPWTLFFDLVRLWCNCRFFRVCQVGWKREEEKERKAHRSSVSHLLAAGHCIRLSNFDHIKICRSSELFLH